MYFSRMRRALDGPEVLPVQQRVGEQPGGRRDVGLDEGVVALAAHPRVPVADVERVVEQLLVVGADVERDGDDPGRVDAGGGGVDGQLADGDAGAAAHPPVADAQDLLGVGGDDQVDVVGPEPKFREGPLDAVRRRRWTGRRRAGGGTRGCSP